MILSTTIARIDGLILVASIDDSQDENELGDVKNKMRQLFRRLDRNSAPEACIESGRFMIYYVVNTDVVFYCICEQSYPRKLAFTYLSDLAQEFTSVYPSQQFLSPNCRPYAYLDFESFIQKTRKTYQDARATANLDKLNDELRDVSKIMNKNIEDLLYRGDSLDKMGDMSSRLRDDSLKYKKAAMRINWELLLKMYGPYAALAFIVIVFLWWRLF